MSIKNIYLLLFWIEIAGCVSPPLKTGRTLEAPSSYLREVITSAKTVGFYPVRVVEHDTGVYVNLTRKDIQLLLITPFQNDANRLSKEISSAVEIYLTNGKPASPRVITPPSPLFKKTLYSIVELSFKDSSICNEFYMKCFRPDGYPFSFDYDLFFITKKSKHVYIIRFWSGHGEYLPEFIKLFD